MSGVTRSLTNAVITIPNATAMTTATARSTTFPRSRNTLNPFIAELLSLLQRGNRQHHFPELLRSVEPGQRRLHVRQRVDAVDHRTQAAIDRFEHGLKLTCVPHCRSKQAGVAKKKARHGDFRFDARRRSARDDASADRQRAHGLLKRGGTDMFEDDIDSVAGRLARRLAESGRI